MLKFFTYKNPNNVGGYTGGVEDQERTWIIFFHKEGRLEYWKKRDANGGTIGRPKIIKIT